MQTILVCDDDKEIVEAIDIYLQQEGYQVLKAYDGEEALCVQLYTGGKTGLQSGSACQEDLQADIGQ